MAINQLRSIETFLKAVEHGSLRGAAAAQGVTPQAASHALAQLEEQLGVRLLHRTTRHIALTQEGKQFLEATQPVLAALDRAVERVRTAKDEIAGPLAIVGPRTIFLPVLWPLVDEFCRRHPAVQPDINLDDRLANWVTDRVDVGFRIARVPEDGLIVRKLFPLQLINCASPAYLAAHGAPKSLDDLVFHRCSVFRHGGNGRALPWYAKVDGQIVSRDIPPAISTNIAELEVEACLAGQVVAQLTCVSAAEHIRSGRLVPVLTRHATDDVGIYLYYGSRSAQPARVRAFIDLAIEKLDGGAGYVLGAKELAAAEAKGVKAFSRRPRAGGRRQTGMNVRSGSIVRTKPRNSLRRRPWASSLSLHSALAVDQARQRSPEAPFGFAESAPLAQSPQRPAIQRSYESTLMHLDNSTRKAFLIGGGIGSLAAAAFMIRDGGLLGRHITVFESLPVTGGSLDGGGDAQRGYTLRGGRMLTTDNYECTWDLFKTIPSLEHPGQTVYDETIEFNERNPSHSRARIVDRNRARIDVTSMGFTLEDRLELLKLAEADDAALGASLITDWLSPRFFETNFWVMWATTFAFQPWHSALEFRRYLHRFMKEFSRIETLAGVKRTVYNQYDSLVRPLVAWLQAQGVQFEADTPVTDLDFDSRDGQHTVTGLHVECDGLARVVPVEAGDLVFFTNASMTDASSFGSMTSAPPRLTKKESGGWALWERIAAGRPGFGRPAAFNSSIAESWWESFTVTLKDPVFFEKMEHFSGNRAGTGGLVTFKDASWLMSVVLAFQPHFAGQPEDVRVFWGYALHPDRVGDFVPKPMAECTGQEILRELCGHLNFDYDATFANANCIPCRMPYITSMFMPRAAGDRPDVVPKASTNLAFVSQFAELPEDVVFTVEYSVRAAQTAVYRLLGVDRPVPPVTPHDHSFKVMLDALTKALA